MPILVSIYCLSLHRYFNINANKIYFIMKRKQYFFTTNGIFISGFIYDSREALKEALLNRFEKGYSGGTLYVHLIDGCNIYYCGSVSYTDFENDFNVLELYD